jgi:hypothetical protein
LAEEKFFEHFGGGGFVPQSLSKVLSFWKISTGQNRGLKYAKFFNDWKGKLDYGLSFN